MKQTFSEVLTGNILRSTHTSYEYVPQLTCVRLGNLAEPIPDNVRTRVQLRRYYAVMARVAAGNAVAARRSCTGDSQQDRGRGGAKVSISSALRTKTTYYQVVYTNRLNFYTILNTAVDYIALPARPLSQR